MKAVGLIKGTAKVCITLALVADFSTHNVEMICLAHLLLLLYALTNPSVISDANITSA